MTRSLCLALVSLFSLTPLANAQFIGAHTAYRLEQRVVRVPQEVTTYRVERHTVMKPQTITTFKEVIETSEQVREYTVQKPVYETQMRDESFITTEPQTTMTTQFQDQGTWEAHTVCRPGTVSQQLAWQPGGWAIDATTGAWVWRAAGLAWVTHQTPATQEVQQVWKPNIVAVQVPQTTMVQKVATRQVPVQVMKFVAEVRQERIPVQTCKRVPVQETRQVAVTEERIVPVKETRFVERVEVFRVPIDPCTGQPLPAVTSSAAPIQAQPQPQPQPADPRTFKDQNGETIRRKPAEQPAEKTEAEKQAEAARQADAAKAAELNANGVKDNSPQWKAKSSAEADALKTDALKTDAAKKAADAGNVDLKKPALDGNGQTDAQKSVLKDNP
jgi:hypothetical protein